MRCNPSVEALRRRHSKVTSRSSMLDRIGDGTHLKLTLCTEGVRVPAVWFRARRTVDEPLPCGVGDMAHFICELSDNVYRRRRSLQLKIVAKAD